MIEKTGPIIFANQPHEGIVGKTEIFSAINITWAIGYAGVDHVDLSGQLSVGSPVTGKIKDILDKDFSDSVNTIIIDTLSATSLGGGVSFCRRLEESLISPGAGFSFPGSVPIRPDVDFLSF
jgi:hypothetical protein